MVRLPSQHKMPPRRSHTLTTARPFPTTTLVTKAKAAMSYIPFPDISPEIFSIDLGPITIALRWYALAYIVGLIAGWKLIVRMITTPRLWAGAAPLQPEAVERLLTWVIAGVILGGRFGYVIFYQPAAFLQDPMQILRIWEGGMSFHGGFLGVALAGIWFCRREKIPMLPLADLMASVAPIGLFLGRLANFINAELWGRPTTLPWGVAFPGDAAQTCGDLLTICARHPSQLYEAALEGLLLFAVLSYLIWRCDWLKSPGRIAGLFFAGYGVARFAVEFVRQPDAQFVTEANPLGLYVQAAGYGLTAGQLLSLPMILVGLWFIARR
jgi:phosphatidylglycerol:prolipoprotein diacylglycerol transferase